MPRVERELTRDGYGCYGLPKDAVNARLIVEWDEPPKNDWTPAKVGLHMEEAWHIKTICEKVAELERSACAEVVNQMMKAYGKEFECEYETLLDAKVKILARTNDEAGYPRLENE